MGTKLYLRFSLLGILSFLIIGAIIFTPARQGALAVPLPTPTLPGGMQYPAALTTSRILPITPVPNRNNGGNPIPMGTSTPVTLIVGDFSRHDYTVEFDSTTTGTKMRCTWGDAYNNAPVNEPTSSLGFEITSSIPYYNEVSATARLDCVSESGAEVIDTLEE